MAGMLRQQHAALVHVEAGDSDEEEVVTIVEKDKLDPAKKILIVTDKHRTVTKFLEAESLEDFVIQGRESLGYGEEEELYAVLEEDGTEVDEEEYFQLLADRTQLMVLSTRELWSPTLSLQGSCLFDDGSRLSSGQLVQALMEHIQKNGKDIDSSAACNMILALGEEDLSVETLSVMGGQGQESTTF